MYYSIGRYINQPLAAEISRVPPDTTTLEIRLNDQSSAVRAGEDFSKGFKNIPPKTNFVSLKDNKLCFKHKTYLSSLLSSLPPTVTGVNLEQNYLGAEAIQAVIKSLPTNVTTLLIGDNELSQYNTAEIISILKAIPPQIKRFSFLDQGFLKKPLNELIEICKAIPQSIESIPELETDNLKLWKTHSQCDTFELKALMSSFNLWEEISNLTEDYSLQIINNGSGTNPSFNLNHYAFKDKSLDEMISILQALSPRIHTLSLSYECFENNYSKVNRLADGECWKKLYNNIDKLLHAIPKTISTLRLDNSTIQYLDKIKTISSIPAHISHLDFSYLDLNRFSLYQYMDVHGSNSSLLKYLPSTITSLSLAGTDPLMHKLYEFSQRISGKDTLVEIENRHSELTRLLSELPATVTFLDLSDNHLETKSNEELLKILSTVNPGTKIKLSSNKIVTLKTLQEGNNITKETIHTNQPSSGTINNFFNKKSKYITPVDQLNNTESLRK